MQIHKSLHCVAKKQSFCFNYVRYIRQSVPVLLHEKTANYTSNVILKSRKRQQLPFKVINPLFVKLLFLIYLFGKSFPCCFVTYAMNINFLSSGACNVVPNELNSNKHFGIRIKRKHLNPDCSCYCAKSFYYDDHCGARTLVIISLL